MDVPPRKARERAAAEEHGNHDMDETLDKQDGEILNGLDALFDTLVGLAAEGSSATVDAGAAAVNVVVHNWFQVLHPALYERLAQSKILNEAGFQKRASDLNLPIDMQEARQQILRLRQEGASLRNRLASAAGVNKKMELRIAELELARREDTIREEDLRMRLSLAQDMMEAATQKRAMASGTGEGGGGVVTDTSVMVAAMEEEIRELEASKLELELELEKARRAEEKVTELEAQKEGLNEELDVVKDDLQEVVERESESSAGASELREEVQDLRRQLEAIEAGEVDGYEEMKWEMDELRERNENLEKRVRGDGFEELRQQVANLEARNERLRRDLERAERGPEDEGNTRGETEHSASMSQRIRELENAARLMYDTNQKLMRDQERLRDLEEETRVLRYANPDLVALAEENRRFKQQLTDLMQGTSGEAAVPATSSSAEVEELRRRNIELEAALLRAQNKTTKTQAELETELEAAQEELRGAEEGLAGLQAAILTAEAARKAGLNTTEKTAGMTQGERFDFNATEIVRNREAFRAIEEMRLTALDTKNRIPSLRGKVTKLKNQLEMRKKEYELEEEANKRAKRTEGQLIAMRLLLV
jgi:hypothetical protein